MTAQVGLDGALRHADHELAQFAEHLLRAAERVVVRHLPNQGNGLRPERRSAWAGARLATLWRAEARAMPLLQRLRSHDEQRWAR